MVTLARLFASQIASVERYTPTSGMIVWPGAAGTHLCLIIERQERPIDVGQGLCLDDDELHRLEEMLRRLA